MNQHLYLHIGSNKTGTTSIQVAFHQNRKELKKQGYLYPGREEKHHIFFFATKSSREYWPRAFNSIDKEILKRSTANFFSTLEKEIASHQGHLVLSTEYLFIDHEAHIKSVLDYLKQFYSEMTVIVFVRDPADLYASGQQQILKARSYATPPDKFQYNFKNVIKAWSRFCPVEVKKYAPETDSCKIFCDTIGVDYNSFSQKDKNRVNTTMSVEQLALLEKIRKKIYLEEENMFKHHLRLIHKVNPRFTNKPVLKKRVRQIIRTRHSSDLEWLKNHYSIDFTSPDLSNENSGEFPLQDEKRATVREIYDVNEETVELYEAALMNGLIMKFLNE